MSRAITLQKFVEHELSPPHSLLHFWYNICTKFHSNPCKDVGGVAKTNFNGTEWRKDGMTDKANTKCPLAILWRGHKNWSYIHVYEWHSNVHMSTIYYHCWWISQANHNLERGRTCLRIRYDRASYRQITITHWSVTPSHDSTLNFDSAYNDSTLNCDSRSYESMLNCDLGHDLMLNYDPG